MAKVLIESARRLGRGGVGPAGCVHKKNIFQTIAVIVENRNPTAYRLQKELFIYGIAGLVFEIETRLDGNIFERDISADHGGVTGPLWRGNMVTWAHALRESEGISAT